MRDLAIIAVDWSGRKDGEAEAIWLARTDRAGQLVELENGRDRDETTGHLIDVARSESRLVVGLDFAFGFPAWWSRKEGWSSGREIWEEISRRGDEILATCSPPFWGRPQKRNPNSQAEGLRQTDRSIGGFAAKSVFQIGGAGAVGTGSIRGMAQLHRLANAGFAIWPFDDPRHGPIAIEIYPRRLTEKVNKGSWRERHRYLLDRHADQPLPLLERAAGSEDAFDAAVSAIVMSKHREQLADLRVVSNDISRLEGLIWAPGLYARDDSGASAA